MAAADALHKIEKGNYDFPKAIGAPHDILRKELTEKQAFKDNGIKLSLE
jgi:hypothetical protein